MDWKDKTYPLSYLYDCADYSEEMGVRTAMGMLLTGDIMPYQANWRRSNSNTRTNLDGNAIKAGYLAELAFDWDKDGPSKPREFVESIEFEVTGHWRNTNTSEVLGGLGR